MTIEIREQDLKVIRGILINGSRFGDTAKELAEALKCSTQTVIAVAKRYDGVKFNGGQILYSAPLGGSFSDACPGITNPRTGISGRVPATIFVKPIRRRK